MKAAQMVKGRHYQIGPYRDSEVVELSFVNYETGLVIVHPPGEPDMQSCFGVQPDLQVFEVHQPSDLTALNKRQAKEGVERLRADLKTLGEIKGDGITK